MDIIRVLIFLSANFLVCFSRLVFVPIQHQGQSLVQVLNVESVGYLYNEPASMQKYPARRVKRGNYEIMNLRDNYPSSPVTAFFGPGGSAHTFGHYTQSYKIPAMYGTHIDMPLKDGKPLNAIIAGYDIVSDSQTRVYNGETFGPINMFPDVNYNQAFNRYKNALDAQSGGKPLPSYEYSPTAFFGRSPFSHDFSYGGGVQPGFTREHVDIDVPVGDANPTGRLGLRVHYRSSNLQPQWNYAHTLDGKDVNGWPQVNWQDQFGDFLNRHQQYVAGNPPQLPAPG